MTVIASLHFGHVRDDYLTLPRTCLRKARERAVGREHHVVSSPEYERTPLLFLVASPWRIVSLRPCEHSLALRQMLSSERTGLRLAQGLLRDRHGALDVSPRDVEMGHRPNASWALRAHTDTTGE